MITLRQSLQFPFLIFELYEQYCVIIITVVLSMEIGVIALWCLFRVWSAKTSAMWRVESDKIGH